MQMIFQDVPLDGMYDTLTTDTSLYNISGKLCHMFTSHPTSIKHWLTSVQSAVSVEGTVPSHVIFLVSSICVVSCDSDVVESALAVLQSIAKYAPDEVFLFLDFLACFWFTCQSCLI